MSSCKSKNIIRHGSLPRWFYFPFVDDIHQVELEAEHIWAFEKNGVYYHGFKFENPGYVQAESIVAYLANLDSKSQRKLLYDLPGI